MYLNLGKIQVNSIEPSVDPYLILASVVSSEMSYDRPVLVTNIEELQIWFGKDFKEYRFFEEMLSMGYTLYLSTAKNKKAPKDQIPYGDWNAITDPVLPEVGQNSILYKPADGNSYVYIYDQFINVEELPQNIDTQYQFEDNRDTLYLCRGGIYLTPTIKGGEYSSNTIKIYGDNGELNPEIRFDRIYNKLDCLAFNLNIDDIDVENLNGAFIILDYINSSTQTRSKKCLYFKELRDSGQTTEADILEKDLRVRDTLDRFTKNFGEKILIHYSPYVQGNPISESIFDNALTNSGYSTEIGRVYSTISVPSNVNYGGVGDGFLVPDHQETQDVLYRNLRKNRNGEDTDVFVKFVSKTIGTVDEKIRIEITENNYLQISRYTYKEIYNLDEEAIVSKINNRSKLITCESYINPSDWPKGSWKMSAAKPIEEVDLWFDETRNILEESDINPDFFLVSDPSKYRYDYQYLLNYASEYGYQILVQNSEDKKDYDRNLVNEVDNRIIYFYGPLVDRPAYYLWLLGISTDRYSIFSRSIPYKVPPPSLTPTLERFKSNYLSDDGTKIYYNTYIKGKNSNTSPWMRFVLGKISRQLQKKKWDYLSEKHIGKALEGIRNILSEISSRHSIITQLSLDSFSTDELGERAYISVRTSISDLVGESISLDITINYSKQRQ